MSIVRRHAIVTCVDMEGGRVDRLSQCQRARPLLRLPDVFCHRNRKLYRRPWEKPLASLAERWVSNTDFAPVVGLWRLKPRAAVRGLRRGGYLTISKQATYLRSVEFLLAGTSVQQACWSNQAFFPGSGEANLDTHHELPNVEKPWNKLWPADHGSIYRALRRESPLILVGHACLSCR